jgi:hypothetical protein
LILTLATVAPEDSAIVAFSTIWRATFGSYPFKLWTALSNDENQTNDTIVGTIEVVGDSWVQLENILLGTRNKKVKEGGCLTYCSDQNLIYAFKGNNTNEFYAYDNVGQGFSLANKKQPIKGCPTLNSLGWLYLRVNSL